MDAPRSAPSGESADWRVVALLVVSPFIVGLSVGAAIYYLFSWLEFR